MARPLVDLLMTEVRGTGVLSVQKQRELERNLMRLLGDMEGANRRSSVSAAVEPPSRMVLFTLEGVLSVEALPFRVYNAVGALTIEQVYLSVGTAPVGAAIIVDVNKNGTSIFGTRPQIAAGSNSGASAAISTSVWGTLDYLTADIDQVGSSTPGSNLVVHVIVS